MDALALKPEDLALSDAARKLIGESGTRLELHCISFSHYCERARWYLRLTHVPYVETGHYAPMAHMFPMIKLTKRFKAKSPKSTASSRSPAVTPTLALYDSSGTPIDLIRNSALIGRFAQLHGAACASKSSTAAPGAALYGQGLTLTADGQTWTSADPALYKRITELELRLSTVIGVEVRRYSYFHLLGHSLLTQFFRNNSSGAQKWLAGFLALLASLALPSLLKINKHTAARALERLKTEFDYFDQLLTEQEKAAEAAAAAEGDRHRLPFYLLGQTLTAADVSLATLTYPIMPLMGLLETWTCPTEQLPQPLQDLRQDLASRPTGRFVRRMWEVHGPLAAKAAAQL